MYQRRSNLQNLMILLLDCLTIVVSLILANYIRNGRLFESDDAGWISAFCSEQCLSFFWQ